jgi:hypothetical protein
VRTEKGRGREIERIERMKRISRAEFPPDSENTRRKPQKHSHAHENENESAKESRRPAQIGKGKERHSETTSRAAKCKSENTKHQTQN